MSLKRKRTVAEEKRVFNSKWELDYFVIVTEAHTMMCLVCNQVVKTVKEDNAKQHFCRHMAHIYAKLEGESRKICVKNFKESLRQQTSCMSTFIKPTLIIAAKLPIELHIILVRRGSLIPMEISLSNVL